MTGLNPSEDVILQISCYITDHELNLLDEEGHETVVHYEKEVLDRMGDWCQKTHSSVTLTLPLLSPSPCLANFPPSAIDRPHSPRPRINRNSRPSHRRTSRIR